MRKLFVVIMILLFVLAIGCAKKAEPAPEPAPAPVPQPAPEMNAVEPEKESVVAPPEPEVEEEKEIAPVGNRVEGTELEPVDETAEEGVLEIALNTDKTLNSTDRTVSAGTTIAFKNYDSWPHQMAVETGTGWDTVRHAESSRLIEGSVWEYTFNDKGTFLVRDIFSGDMRLYVTVE